MFAVFVFLAVVGIGGFIFFRTFSQSGNILADIVAQSSGREVLQNNDFGTSPSFDIYTWSRLSNGGNIPNVKDGWLAFGITESKPDAYQTISQPVPLLKGKKYEITVEAGAKDSGTLKSEIGFLEKGIVSRSVFTETVVFDKTKGLDVFTATFVPTQDFKNAGFYFKVTSGPGTLNIAKFSVLEKESDGNITKTPAPTSTTTQSPATVVPAQSAVPPTATATVTPAPSPTSTPAPTSTAIPQNNGSPTLNPKRTPYGFSFPINTTELTAKKITVYRYLNGKWQVASPGKSNSNFTTNPQDGLILENPTEEDIKLTVSPSTQQSTAMPKDGWNLIYNQAETPADSYVLKTEDGKVGIREALSQQLISETFYLVKQTDRGLALQKKNFAKDTVPEGVIYVYFF